LASSLEKTEDLIQLIYAVLLGEATWVQFLDALMAGVPLGRAVMVMHGINDPEQGYVPIHAGFDAKSIETYNAHFAPLNVWQPPLTRQRAGVGFCDEQLLPPGELARSEFFNDYLVPNEINAMACAKIGDDEKYAFSIATLSERDDAQLKQVMADRLTSVGPHLRRAFNYYRKEPSSRRATELGAALFDAIDIGVAVIGDGASVKAISTTGQGMLAEDSPARISALGRFGLRDAQHQAHLSRMLERRYEGPNVTTLLWRATKLTLIRMSKDDVSLYFEGPTVIVLMEQLGNAATAFDSDFVAHVYGLTKAERRAVSGIVAGKSVDQIAQEASLSRETIRVQMKSLYAKTGASSEADILRRLRFRGMTHTDG
jgi:DNA-binding CsgD family transcriptional regulator